MSRRIMTKEALTNGAADFLEKCDPITFVLLSAVSRHARLCGREEGRGVANAHQIPTSRRSIGKRGRGQHLASRTVRDELTVLHIPHYLQHHRHTWLRKLANQPARFAPSPTLARARTRRKPRTKIQAERKQRS